MELELHQKLHVGIAVRFVSKRGEVVRRKSPGLLAFFWKVSFHQPPIDMLGD